MRKTILPLVPVISLLLLHAVEVRGQGFVNLDFECANLSGYSPGLVPTTDAIPGWTATSNGSPEAYIAYNSPGSIEIVGATTIQGNYHVSLQGRRSVNVAIGQTGTLADTTQSLTFWGDVHLGTVSFEGQDLTLVVLGQTPNYDIYGADISGFAGRTGELVFSTTGTAFAIIDNIQFSPAAIPEPTTLSLAGLAFAALSFWRSRT